jgi:hypothetical protein
MRKFLSAFGILCFFALIVLGVIQICRYSNNQEFENQCLIEYPKVLISGKIYYRYGVFYSGPIEYSLYYEGKTRKAREECKVRIPVTESEYERKMYAP